MTIIPKPTEGFCTDSATLPYINVSVFSVTELETVHEHIDIFYGEHTSQHAKLFAIKAGVDLAIDAEKKTIWTNSDCCVKWINNGTISADVIEKGEIIKLSSIIHRLCKEHNIKVKFWSKRLWGKIPGHLTKGSINNALANSQLKA